MHKFIPQNFNDFLALIVIIILIGYIFLTSWLGWDNKIVDLAAGIFLAKFSDIIQYYFRKSKTEDTPKT